MATPSESVAEILGPPRAPAASQWLVRALSSTGGRLAIPSLADLFFIALIGWLFVAGTGGWAGLLADGDCGWHIRTGEYILDHGAAPRVDLFSFSKTGQAWYAWEWLSDVFFALLFRWAGLKAIVLTAGIVIAVYATTLLRRIFAQGPNVFIALIVCLWSIGSASIHFLARPHIFTLLFLVGSLWVIDEDRKHQTPWVWLLVPLTVLWTNMHGGFLALILALGALTAGSVIENWLHTGPGWSAVRRYALLTGACIAASLVNPYGLQLHLHIAEYLRSDWIRNVVQEFQSPNFRSENLMQFEILLFLGLFTAASCLKRGRITECLWIAGFAHLSLASVRHVPIFVSVAAPLIAAELTPLWSAWSGSQGKKSAAAIIDSLSRDLAPGFRRMSSWPVVAVVVLALAGEQMHWPQDFPALSFPTRMVAAHASLLQTHRVFSYDQWGDYLIFKGYPRQRVFVDGRSDFYGQALGDDYMHAIQARWDWRSVLEKYRIDAVLAPVDWPLNAVLKQDSGWRLLADDGQAVLFLKEVPISTVRAKVPAELRF